jgi:hypothetical protein
MIVQQWENVKDLLHQAMQLAPEQRARFLDAACSSGDARRAEVESLLLAYEASAPASCNRRPRPRDWATKNIGTTLLARWRRDRSSRSVFNSYASLAKAAWARSGWPNRPLRCGGKWP